MKHVISYSGSTISINDSNLQDNDLVYIELGPTSGPPDVTLTVVGALGVSDPASGRWPDGSRTFTSPLDDLEVTSGDAAALKKIYLNIKPGGGLPGGKPI